MKTFTYLKALMPSNAVLLALTVMPAGLTAYLLIAQYTNTFLSAQNGARYTAADQTWLGKLLIEQPWAQWLSRFSDLAFWGTLTAVTLVTIWAISAMRTGMRNHLITEEFRNFKVPKRSWHRHFTVQIGLKVLLIGIVLYAAITLLTQAVPELAQSIGLLLNAVDRPTVAAIALCNLVIFGLQLLAAIALKLFRYVQLD